MYDVIVVGARCAGAPTAMLLARKGYRVLLLDRASFPSDVISTHCIHQTGVARLKRWGLLDRITASNCPPISRMSFDDARKILNGGDTAATDFFRTKTTPQLTTAFRPPVSQSMSQVGVTRQYKDLVSRFESIPFARSQAFDLDGYVVDKGLAGLFHVLGEQEKQIRTNPTARVTDLLKEVFKK